MVNQLHTFDVYLTDPEETLVSLVILYTWYRHHGWQIKSYRGWNMHSKIQAVITSPRWNDLRSWFTVHIVTALLLRLNRSNWGKQSDFNPDPFVSWITAVPHLHPCPWPGVCGQPLLCCGPCCRCVCFRDCQTSAAFCREEWRLRSRASSRAGGPLLDGSWMSIWESAETNHTSDLRQIIHHVFTMTSLYL